jgi:nucleoid DNA-binding protein/cell division septation protein DedD
MIIDKEQLISLLKEKTGLERKRVEDQLAELIKRIKKAAEKDKTFEIEDFGTFSMEEDNLRFEPSDKLETEINNKYAGMKPIELIGAFKEPKGDEVPEIDENLDDAKDKVWAFDKEADEEKITSEEPADEELAEQQEPNTAEGKMEKAFEMLSGMEDQTTFREDTADETAKVEDESPKAIAEGKEEKDTVGKLLVAAVIVIAVGLSGWVVYDTGLISNNSSAENGQQAAQLSAQQNMNSQEESFPSQESTLQDSEENNTSEPEQELAVGKQEEPQSEEESKEETTFGLKGEVNETISNGYTIVVHSLRSIEVAENRRNNLREAGYRALISKAEVQGTTYFRVGLGQYPTVDAAQQAVSDIPESYQSNQNHFIIRIK